MMRNKNAIELLEDYYASIRNNPGPLNILDEIRHKTKGGRIQDVKKLTTAAEKLAQDKHIGDKYSFDWLFSHIEEQMHAIFWQAPTTPSQQIKAFVNELSRSKATEMNVYMPIHGLSFKKKKRVGNFEFIPANPKKSGADDINNFLQDQDRVMTTVLACEEGKAEEKAYAEFQWLENAFRLFNDRAFSDVGITSFDYRHADHVLVKTRTGTYCSSNGKGAVILLALNKALAQNQPTFFVISKLGCDINSLTEMQRRLRHAVHLGGLSVQAPLPAMAFFLCIVAMEALFSNENVGYVSPSIAQTIVEAHCYLLGRKNNRRAIFEQIKSFYHKRSCFAHGNAKNKVTVSDVRLAQNYLRAAILRLLKDPKLSRLKSTDEVREFILEKKFGV